jgi:hypothetical protein
LDNGKAKLEFHFNGKPGDEHAVPVAVVTQVLQAAQKAMLLFGMQVEGRSEKERFRATAEVERKYVLRVSVPREGSVTFPAELGDPASGLFAPADVARVAEHFGAFSAALASEEPDRLRDLVPDSPTRRRLLETYRAMTPAPGSNWRMYVQGAGYARIDFNDKLFHTVRHFLRAEKTQEDRIESQTVTGKLLKIDFAENKLTIQYPPTNKALECFYEPELEELLFENRRDFIQVTGNVILDGEGNPEKITGVNEIAELDTSPIEIAEVLYGAGFLRIDPPLSVTPVPTESYQYLTAEVGEFGLYITAPTREKLVDELSGEIKFIWEEYGKAKSDELVEAARGLREALCQRITEVAGES